MAEKIGGFSLNKGNNAKVSGYFLKTVGIFKTIKKLSGYFKPMYIFQKGIENILFYSKNE